MVDGSLEDVRMMGKFEPDHGDSHPPTIHRVYRISGHHGDISQKVDRFTLGDLLSGLHSIGEYWKPLDRDIRARFPLRKNAPEDASDLAYIAVDLDDGTVAADVLILSDRRYPGLGLHTLVHTRKFYESQGLCGGLMQLSTEDWFQNGGKMLVLHTESARGHSIYETVGYIDWYGSAPKKNDFSEKGVMMLNTEHETRPEKVISHYFDGSGELTVETLTRADAAQFVLFASAYQSGFGFSSGYDHEPLQIPSLSAREHWIPDCRFMQQCLFGDRSDVLLALKADSKLVGVAALTYPNERLNRTEISEAVFVHPNYSHGADMLRDALAQRR